MANDYQIDFTDLNSNRSITISPYTTNGPISPSSGTLNDKSASALTSLLLYGQGTASYGERINENMVHLLEHFANITEPFYPTNGQMWWNTGTIPGQLHVYSAFKHVIISNEAPNAGSLSHVTITGDHTSRLVTGFRVRIANSTTSVQEDYIIQAGGILDFNSNTVFQIQPTPTGSLVSLYVGGWEFIRQDNTPLNSNLDLNGFCITNVCDPTSDTEVGDRLYNDSRYVQITGDIMTGALALPGNPTNALHAATKGYVDSEITDAGSSYVQINGDTMTGTLTLSGAPTNTLHAATKGYVDSIINITSINDLTDVTITGVIDGELLVYNTGSSSWINTAVSALPYVRTTGDNMTGFLTLFGDPVTSLHSATKQYVDGSVVTSGSYDAVAGNLTLTKSIGGAIIVEGFANSTSDVLHDNKVDVTDGIGDLIEADHYADVDYPEVLLNGIIQKTSHVLQSGNMPNKRLVFTSTGATTYTLTYPDGGSPERTLEYINGYDHMHVYVDGIKWIADTRGFVIVKHDLASDFGSSGVEATQPSGYQLSADTGLDVTASPLPVYNLDVSFDGGSPITNVAVSGPSIATIGGLIDEINLQLTGGKVVLSGTELQFYSDTTGAGSVVTVVDGTSPGLIANLVGEITESGSPLATPVWNIADSYSVGEYVQYTYTTGPDNGLVQHFKAITANIGINPETDTADNWRIAKRYDSVINTAVNGAAHGYSEDGAFGVISDSVTFNPTVPIVSAIIEVITDNPLLYSYGK